MLMHAVCMTLVLAASAYTARHPRVARGAAARHARLHERRHGPTERLSGAMGTVRCGWRRGGEVTVAGERSSERFSTSSASIEPRLSDIPWAARWQPFIGYR